MQNASSSLTFHIVSYQSLSRLILFTQHFFQLGLEWLAIRSCIKASFIPLKNVKWRIALLAEIPEKVLVHIEINKKLSLNYLEDMQST